jgi:hypothetical protein
MPIRTARGGPSYTVPMWTQTRTAEREVTVNANELFLSAADSHGQHISRFHPGDLVVPRAGYPTLCEVITVEAPGMLRIRGVEWLPGYSAEVLAQEYYPVSSILSES